MPGTVGVIHHERSYFPVDLHEAIGDAARLVWILVDGYGQAASEQRLLRHLGRVVAIESQDLELAAQTLTEAGIDGIVTFVDDHLVLAADLAAMLGLPHHTPAVARTVANKYLQRSALAAAGVPGPCFWHLPAGLDHDALERAIAEVTYPAVLKPVHGSASRGIVEVASADALRSAHRPNVEHIVEAYLPDTPARDARFASYLSVESVVSHAEISHVALTGRFPLEGSCRETGNFIPAAVPAGLEQQLLEIADQAIRALGITDAALHTEIKLTPAGPRVIEVNGRLGGRPPFVLQRVSDVNLFRAACEIALGRPVRYRGLAECRGVGFWRMIQPPACAREVANVHGAAEVMAFPGVDTVRIRRGPGEPVDVALGTDGAVATVHGSAETLDALASVIEAIDEGLRFDYLVEAAV